MRRNEEEWGMERRLEDWCISSEVHRVSYTRMFATTAARRDNNDVEYRALLTRLIMQCQTD
jgi:hypothetical protein